MDCKSCICYPEDPAAEYCNMGRRLTRPSLQTCGAYAQGMVAESAPVPSKKPLPGDLTITIGSRAWHVFHNAVQALYKNKSYSSKTARFLLDTLEPDSGDHLNTLQMWDRERHLFIEEGLSEVGAYHLIYNWRDRLDTLRQLFLDGEIDENCLLAALDFEHTGSPAVADLVDIWSALRLARLDTEDVFDHPAYEEPELD